MLKNITLKAIEKEIGHIDNGTRLTMQQAFLLVYGAGEWLGDKAWAGTRVTEVQIPSNAAMRKLAKKIQREAAQYKK